MTVSTIDSVVSYDAGGPGFPIPYRFLQNSDIEAVVVKQDGTSETLTSAQYTLTGAGAQDGGTLFSTYAASILSSPGNLLTISRVMLAVQPTDLRNQGRYFAETHENVFDRLTMLIQQGLATFVLALTRPVGRDYFFAEDRRIASVKDPVEPQDAATKKSVETYVSGILETGQGPINNASNVVYVTADGDVTSVQKGIRRTFSSISALVGKVGQINKEMISVTAYHDGWAATGDGPLGGGDYIWDALRPKTAHNGGTVISPTVPWSGSQATLSAFLAGAGETLPAGLGCWVLSRNVQINPFVFGAKGDDVADDTASVQKMLNTLPLSRRKGVIPRTPVAFRVTAPLLVSKSLQLEGDGCDLYNATIINNQNVRGPGSWIHFAHTGKGFDFQASSGELTGVVMKGFGTYRDHAAPIAGWIPTVHDFDFNCTSLNGDYTFKELVLWNPYRGFHLNGRVHLCDIKMQALNIGARTEICGDTSRFNKIHNWPFWSTHDSVKTYCLSNMTNLWFYRTDNPTITDCFSLWSNAGLRISEGANGTVSRLRMSDFDFDASRYGIWVDSTVISGATVAITNGSTQGESGVANSTGIFIQGNNCRFDISNMVSSNHQLDSLRVDGTGNNVNLGNFEPKNWNLSSSGFPAIYCGTGNTLNCNSVPNVQGGFNGDLFGGGGVIKSPLSSGSYSGTTDASGLLSVTHNAKAIPGVIVPSITGPDADINVRVNSRNSTTFVLKFRKTDGTSYVGSVAGDFITMYS
ncbi:hypothetical protein [Pseudomonas protegens]|uniref:hypothetical protein n=1 Tax=Pseudomonas protegens TaxID=380021 RepID=UPI0011CEABA5|nr:hypothetical protein [Pseudomonas protegens]